MVIALHVGSGTPVGPLTVFPVWTGAPQAARRRYVTTGAVVEELPDPRVDTLRVSNPRHRSMLVCEGVELEAGLQHRAVTASVVVPAGATRDVEVVCVEAGRWNGGTAQSGGRRRVPMAVRGALRGLAAPHGEQRGRQGEVWHRVAGFQDRHGRTSTGSLVDVQRAVDERVRRLVAGSAPLPGQRGVVVAAGGHPVLLEVFDHPATLATHWRSILGGVALDVLDTAPVATPAWRARTFVQQVQAVAAGGRSPLADVRCTPDPEDRAHLAHLVAVNARHRLVLAA